MMSPDESPSISLYGIGDALKEIAEWARGRPGWQQQALRWLLDEGHLSDERITTLLSLALEQKPAAEKVTAGDMRLAEAARQTVSLISVDQVSNVNALATGQCLTFGQQGLTIIYGRNGAGKSGYARILRHACRARRPQKDVILPNIDGQSHSTVSARIRYSLNGQTRTAQWYHGKSSDDALSAVSVFDSLTAPIHVDEVNEVAYTPYPLQLLEQLAAATMALRAKATDLKAQLEEQTPDALRNPRVDGNTAVGRLLASLSHATTEAQVNSLAQVSLDDHGRLDGLKRDLSSDPRVAAQRLRSVRAELLRLRDDMVAIGNVAARASQVALRNAWLEKEASRGALALAAASGFEGEPLPGIGGEAWRTLWEAARAYAAEAYPSRVFPETAEEDRCVLCQQELSAQAADRLRRFDEFVRDEVGRRAERATEAYAAEYKRVSDAVFSRHRLIQLRALFAEHGGEVAKKRLVRTAVLLLTRNAKRLLREHKVQDVSLTEVDVSEAAAALDKIAKELDHRATAVLGQAGSEERTRLETEARELTDRTWLANIKVDVLNEIARKRRLANIQRVVAECATTAITVKSTDLAEKLITDALRARFSEAVRGLGVDYAGVELRREQSRSGSPRFRVRFIRKPEVGVGKILSEGEHRAVALAAFLAEQATAGGHSTVIFDDPVSSLDNEHREEVARALVSEAKSRQVIVFTHDLAFLLLVDRISVEEGCPKPKYRCVNRGRLGVGFCSTEVPYNARSVSDVLQSIENDLENRTALFDLGREHEWRIAVRTFQEQLRECWERAVEDFVSPVCRRMSPKIDTRGLEKLTRLSDTDCRQMRSGFSRCSELLHSSPDVINPPLPSPDRIRAEIHQIREWHSRICSGR
jgi:ABC-type cobalamin/Fe3+-siderophores transport system ATPase subunit